MAASPTPNPALIKEIAESWEKAKAQLEELRAQVTHNAEVVQLKLESSFLNRERDQALRDFGEAVWKQIVRGRLELPLQLYGALEQMISVEKRLAKQAAEITDILKEGDEAADRLHQKKAVKPAPSLASKSKKR